MDRILLQAYGISNGTVEIIAIVDGNSVKFCAETRIYPRGFSEVKKDAMNIPHKEVCPTVLQLIKEFGNCTTPMPLSSALARLTHELWGEYIKISAST